MVDSSMDGFVERAALSRVSAPFGMREFNLVVSGAILALASFWVMERSLGAPPARRTQVVKEAVPVRAAPPSQEVTPPPAPPVAAAAAEIEHETSAPKAVPSSSSKPRGSKGKGGNKPRPTRSEAGAVSIDDCAGKGPLCALPE